MNIMSEKRSWQWNYFTEISMHNVICDICDTILKTILHKETALTIHLDAEHDQIYTKNIQTSMFKVQEISKVTNLDIYYFYDIPQQTATCKRCGFVFYQITHGISPQMTGHLNTFHGVYKSNWRKLKEWICTHMKNCRQDYHTYHEVMTINRCRTCKSSNPLSHNNGINWVKHLIQHGLENLPLEIAPVQELVNRFRNFSFPKNVENVSLTGHPTPPSDSNVLSENPDYNPSACKKFIGLSFAKYKSAAVQSSFKSSTSSDLVHHDSEESKTTEANKECNKCADNNPSNDDIENMINSIFEEYKDSVPLEYQEHDKDILPSYYQQTLNDLDLFFKTYPQNVSEHTNSPETSNLDIATASSTNYSCQEPPEERPSKRRKFGSESGEEDD